MFCWEERRRRTATFESERSWDSEVPTFAHCPFRLADRTWNKPLTHLHHCQPSSRWIGWIGCHCWRPLWGPRIVKVAVAPLLPLDRPVRPRFPFLCHEPRSRPVSSVRATDPQCGHSCGPAVVALPSTPSAMVQDAVDWFGSTQLQPTLVPMYHVVLWKS